MKEFRKEYKLKNLLEKDVDKDPFVQFGNWFAEIGKISKLEPNAFAFATSTADGYPSLRMLLLKEYSAQGFVFFTNYESRKGGELKQNSQGAMLFYWPELERQVRIEGVVLKISEEQSDVYFNSRPLSARVAASISPQSKLESRESLEDKWKQAIISADKNPPTRPKYWGGYNLKAHSFEFWQGRESRLHDRIIYLPDKNGNWQIQRLAP